MRNLSLPDLIQTVNQQERQKNANCGAAEPRFRFRLDQVSG
jgi:hypothetical protein